MTEFTELSPLAKIQSWLRDFKSERPNTCGLPLWALKVTDVELQSIVVLLRSLFVGKSSTIILSRYSCRGYDKASEFDQLFTLYIATWLQRNYKGERLRWPPVLENVCIKHTSSLMPHIYQSIDNGLDGWGVKIYSTQSRDQYFATLYCQGGFPRAGLVGLTHGPVPNYLNAVIQQYSQFHHTASAEDIAFQAMDELPVTLRQKPFAQLAAQLINSLLKLRDKYHLYSELDPVLALDLKSPDWRNELPFLLCDEEAYELMRKLLRRTASLIKRDQNPVRISRYIEPGINSWQLIAETHINYTIHPEDLTRCIGCDDLPTFFDLYTQTESGERSRSASFNLKGIGAKRWQVVTNETRFFNSHAASEINFELWSDGNKLNENTYYRGEELNPDLPWVFSVSGERYRFLSQGNTKVAQDKVLVVFSGKLEPANILSSVDIVGELGALGQTIYSVVGQVYAEVRSGRFEITTSAEEAKVLNCWLNGHRCTEAISSKHVYKGIPNIYYREGVGQKELVPQSQLYWQSINSERVTPLVKDQIEHGVGIISWRRNDELQWQSKCVLLPEESEFDVISYEQGELELKVIGFGENIDVGLVEGQDKWLRGVDKYDGLYLGEIQLPKKMSEVINPVLSWNSSKNNKVTFELATNQSGVCLLTPDGRPFSRTRSVLTLDDLYSHKLKIQLPPESKRRFLNISAVLVKKRNHEAFVSHHIELEESDSQIISSSVLAKLAQLLFNQSSDLRDVVTFRFYGDEELESSVPKVEFYKHHVINHFDDNTLVGVKVLNPFSHKNRDNLRMYAAPMWELNRKPVELEKTTNSHHDIIFSLPKTTDFGPWFIYSPPENKIQPRAVIIDDQSTFKTETSEEQTSSEQISLKDENNSRLSVAIRELRFDYDNNSFNFSEMDSVITDLSEDINHNDWQVVQGFVEALDYAEPNTFHVINRILHSPKALALLLLKQSEPRNFENVWQTASKMPFEWLNLPTSIWVHAIDQSCKNIDELLKPLVGVLSDKQYEDAKKGLLTSKLEPFTSKGAYFKAVTELCLYELYDIEPEWLSVPIWGESNAMIQTFLTEKRELFSRHEGKLLHNVQNRKNDLRLRELLNSVFNRNLLPGILKGLVQSPDLESDKADYRAVVIDLPVKVALNNMNVFSREARVEQVLGDSEQLLLNFALTRLQQFDRQWLQASMACAVKAAAIYKLESMDQ
ncbi:STY4851/ECs_5259 family protein [Vibrio parahaemolyticus]|nr:STY4851/ECs_5259 family protein [Vibrio parahaemolyticus]MDF4425778.1 STY4851/ECs_5259 family protein [Vibrio parahaemolyticus]MDF4434972.1 STY4851/ECs_5259 family protein [Vibrio parahaemolyticus]MDF4444619.1 STY4851/ECs_5259 family protein [Vibrio parahaemolyticus]HCG7478654.1 hypothetical protein [Vibrio parahaemolyticus]